ncbi:MAG: hypothetical protein R3F11_12660 [Verrucomicrobiales bacterium]
MPSPENLLAMFMFSVIGFAAFVYGKRMSEPKPLIVGIALMVYPYFVSATWLICVIGAVLTAALFFPRQ